MIVLDASAVIELVLRSGAGRAVEARIADESLHAPQLILIEAAQVMRRLTRAGVVTAARADEALTDIRDLGVALYGHEALVGRVWLLRDSLTAYDAAYVALAEGLEAPVVTFDERLAAATGHLAEVEVLTPG